MSDARYKLEDLIIDLCTSGSPNLDQIKLKEIKKICKENDQNIKFCHEILIIQLAKEHSEIRYSAFQIVDCLFQRSHLFRELILDEAQTLFEYVLETNLDNPLPPPKKTAAELKKNAARIIKNWHDKFGAIYKLLELGYNYLKDCKKVDFVSFSHQSNAQRAHVQKQNDKQQILLNKKYIEYLSQFNESEPDIKNCIEQLERCINILIPKPEDLFSANDESKRYNTIETEIAPSTSSGLKSNHELVCNANDSDDSEDDADFEEVPIDKKIDEDIELRYLGFINDKGSEFNRNYNLELSVDLKIDDENKIVIEIMKDLYKELKKTHITKLNLWIKNFTSVKQGTASLKKVIEIKNSVQDIVKKFETLNIPIESEEDVLDKKKLNENSDCLDLNPGTSMSKSQSESNLNNHKLETSLNEDSDDEEVKRKKRKIEMLKIAPVVNLNELEYLPIVTQKVEATNPLFQRREMEISQDLGGGRQMAKKAFIGKFEPVKWCCRAPLKNGKLCPRMDRFKCPLHGKIVARDEIGQIVNEKDKNDPAVKVGTVKSSELMPWQDPDLIADINAATGKNIQVVDPNNKKARKNKKKSNLTDLRKEEETPRKRLERRLLTAKNLNKIGNILDSIEHRLNHEKFHHNFNYALQN